MTTITDSELQVLQARFAGSLKDHAQAQLPRIGWDREQLAAHQRNGLRALTSWSNSAIICSLVITGSRGRSSSSNCSISISLSRRA